MVRIIVGCLVVLAAAVGCGSAGDLSADNPAFDGLPRAVVAERLADPALQDMRRADDTAERAAIMQRNVAMTVFCRDTLAEYQNWVQTGQSPSVPSMVSPVNPTPEFWPNMKKFLIDEVADAMRSGDPAVLRSWMLLYGGCRDFVADPAVSMKTTIADVLEGKS